MAPSKRGKKSRECVSLDLQEDWSDTALKKEAWLRVICQRRSAADAAEDLEYAIDAATVAAFAQEVEKLRMSLGLHWTWFEEELTSGRYDAQLAGGDSLLPPAMEEAYHEVDMRLAKLKTWRSPASTRSSSFQSPQSAPRSPPMQAKRIDIPQEVWLAAEKHRKSNFFAAAMLPCCKPTTQLLSFLEVCGLVDLCMASKDLGLLLSRWPHGAKGVPFAGDAEWRGVTWARRQRFLKRLRLGQAEAAVVVPLVEALGGPGTVLGPFLASSTSSCGRLVVREHQSFHVVDVQRLGREEVEMDRFGSTRLLRSSQGLHSEKATTSWPQQAPLCCAGGVLAARPAGTQCSAVLQWLELPDHSGSKDEARRTSMRQEQLQAAVPVSSGAYVESMWPLCEDEVLLVVRDPAKTGVCVEADIWMQVWSIDAQDQELQPGVKCRAPPVRCMDGGEQLLLCGFQQHVELFDRDLRSRRRWEVAGTTHVLLRREGPEVCILAQESSVFLATGERLQKLLPTQACELSVAGLCPVGQLGFAVCSQQHVFAFEVSASHDAEMTCVVELPPGKAQVEHFFASPYEFFVVMGKEQKRRAICCLWPEEDRMAESGAYAVNLKAWRGSVETSAHAVDLKFLMKGAGIDAMAYHTAKLGCMGQDLLAVSAQGVGLCVFRWGMEVSPALEAVRERRAAKLAYEAEERRREGLRRQLQRLQQRLQETEKLEEKAKGSEALSAEEEAKVAKRPWMEAEVERLVHELGLDQHSEEPESEDEEDLEAVRAEKRRAKERVQRQHHEEKRLLQKERQKNRDRKFS